MTRRCTSRLPALAVALWGLCLTGCRNPAVSGGASPLTSGPEKVAKLTDRQVADLKFALGRSLERRGELAPAADAYQEALHSDPARADACWRLAVLCDREGKCQESLAWYRRALAGMPGNADLYCDMGYSLSLQQRWGEAEMNLRQAVALAPQN